MSVFRALHAALTRPRPERCKNCRIVLDAGTVPVRDAQHAFCSDGCRDEWLEAWVIR